MTVDLLLWVFVFGVSLAVLIKASDYFTDAAENIGLVLGMPAFIVGVTIVSIGTSLPELSSSIFAVLAGASEIVPGEIIGSNIANILIVLGIAAIIARKLEVSWDIVKIDLPLFVGSAVLLAAACLDGVFTTFEAILCVLGFVIYIAYTMSERKRHILELIEAKIECPKIEWRTLLALGVSIVLVYFGAKYTIESVIQISMLLAIGPELIAVSAIALGTSLPELTVTLVAAKKGKPALAIGNVLGSNIFNSFAVMGIVGMIGTLVVPATLITFAIPLMLGATLLYFFVTQDKTVTKWEGWMLVLIYAFFLGTLLGL